MAEQISSWGKPVDEILAQAAERMTPGSLSARINVRDFAGVCVAYGHIVPLELPGAICSFLRTHLGCLYAEVQRIPDQHEPAIVGVFQNEAMLEIAVTQLSSHTFSLDYGLPCPPLEISTGTLIQVIRGKH